jgi:hypothetical protein
MRDPLSLYTPIAEDLPALYRVDQTSWVQIQELLAVVDATWRDYLNQLIELPSLLSPAAPSVVPPGLTPGNDPQLLWERRNEALDQAAAWLACELPDTGEWNAALVDDDRSRRQAVQRKADFLRAAPALWRERSTPTGFLRLLCHWFGLDEHDAAQCPILIEHARYRDEHDTDDEVADAEAHPEPATALQVTLLIPQLPQFHRYERVAQLSEWLDAQAPAHLAIRHLLVAPSYWPTLLAQVLPAARRVEDILGAVREHLPTSHDLHLAEAEAEGQPQRPDDLDLGRLPSRTPTDHRPQE